MEREREKGRSVHIRLATVHLLLEGGNVLFVTHTLVVKGKLLQRLSHEVRHEQEHLWCVGFFAFWVGVGTGESPVTYHSRHNGTATLPLMFCSVLELVELECTETVEFVGCPVTPLCGAGHVKQVRDH